MSTDTASLLSQLQGQLQACEQGQMPLRQLCQNWRSSALDLPLPARFGQVLGGLLDRLEAGALFSEESCSFSQKDLLQSLQLWLDKARQQLA
jgi:hypothetical protein